MYVHTPHVGPDGEFYINPKDSEEAWWIVYMQDHDREENEYCNQRISTPRPEFPDLERLAQEAITDAIVDWFWTLGPDPAHQSSFGFPEGADETELIIRDYFDSSTRIQ
jgi:hypothetical protein